MGGGASPPGALAVRTSEDGNVGASSSSVPDGSAGATTGRLERRAPDGAGVPGACWVRAGRVRAACGWSQAL